MSRAPVALLTGRIGCGKTTVAGRVAERARQQGLVAGGLLAPALGDDHGRKLGIWGVDLLSGERRLLALTDRVLDGPCVGPYGFDGAALRWALKVVETALDSRAAPHCDLVIVDEIGKLELWHDAGLAPLLPRLASGVTRQTLLIVRDTLFDELKSRLGRPDLIVFEVDDDNREQLPSRIAARLFQNPQHR